MTTRQHLRGLHEAMADFHTRAAQSHAAVAKCFSKSNMEGGEEIAAEHEHLAQAHVDAAKHAVSCCKSLDLASKAVGLGDDDAVVPIPGISSVYKRDFDPSTVRLVARNGAPQSPLGEANVPVEFAKLIQIEDEES